jgi:hypothetical protein
MTETEFVVLVLGLMFMASNLYWAWHSQTLVNKLMSRNFFEYQAASVTTDKPKATVKKDNFAIDDMSSMTEFM